MTITILSAKKFAKKLKATVHRSGKLGFGEETAHTLGLEQGKFARFAQDDETGNLFLIIDDCGSEDAFSFKEVSGFYNLATRQLFDALGIDYENNSVMFDLVRQPTLDADLAGQVYYMKMRTNKRKEKNDDIIEP